MTTSLVFGAALKKRLLLAVTVFGSASLVACGDSGSGSGGEAAGGGDAGGAPAGGQAAGGEASGGAPAGGAPAGGAGGAAEGGAGGGPMGQENVERCFANPNPDAECPALADAQTYFTCTDTSELVLEWLSGPTPDAALCCYQVDVSAANDPSCGAVGRPFVVENAAQRARVVAARDAGAWRHGPDLPDVSGLAPETRAVLARAWADDASYEHASVASFAKFSLELLALGAPAELVRRAHQAALDEVRHAELGFALASGYAGHALAPSTLGKAADVRCNGDLESILRAVIHEGCVGETIAAVVASAQQMVATDRAVRAALTTIAIDEASHAELAWRTVAWVLRAFGSEAERTAKEAFESAIEQALGAIVPEADAQHAHGRLSAEEQRVERERAVREVVRPAVAALFAAR